MLESSRWNDGSIREEVDLAVLAFDKDGQRFVGHRVAMHQNQSLKRVAEKQFLHDILIIPASNFASAQIFQIRTRLDDLLQATSVDVVAPRDIEVLELGAVRSDDFHP